MSSVVGKLFQRRSSSVNIYRDIRILSSYIDVRYLGSRGSSSSPSSKTVSFSSTSQQQQQKGKGSSQPPNVIRIGNNIERVVLDPSYLTIEQRRKIPTGYLHKFMDDPVAQTHLQWLIQKDILQQDCLLISMIGSDTIRCRHIAYAYAEVTQQPVEYISLSHDTSESDLKQRRSIQQHQQQQQQNSTNSNVSTNPSSSQIIFQNQAPVRAAIQGHLLILDGLHRVERNVLPTLNNLLENREMPLEDGRLLISQMRYQQLVLQQRQQQQQYGNDPSVLGTSPSYNMNKFLIPVHHNFKVLALISYDPNQKQQCKLDPPVRSRFQIRRIDSVPTDILYDQLLVTEDELVDTQLRVEQGYFNRNDTVFSQKSDDYLNDQQRRASQKTGYVTDAKSAKQLAIFATAMNTDITSTVNDTSGIIDQIIPFPMHSMTYIQRLVNRYPNQSISDFIERMYPYCNVSESRMYSVLNKWPVAVTSRNKVQRIYREMKLVSKSTIPSGQQQQPVYDFSHTESIPNDPYHIQLHFIQNDVNNNEVGQPHHLTTIKVKAVSGGGINNKTNSSTALNPNEASRTSNFVSTAGSKHVLTSMLQEHSVGRDILLVSPKGEGKSTIVEHFSDILGYRIHLFPLYKEMTANDLLRRSSSSSSSSTNRNIFDDGSTSRDWSESPLLVAARTGQVCILDGIDKLSRDCLSTIQGFLTDREVMLPDGTKYVHPSFSENIKSKIHPSFRVIALASIASGSNVGNSVAPTWMSQDVTSMFSTIAMPSPSRVCIQEILKPYNKLSESDLDKLLMFREKLLSSADDCGVSPMSLRTMKRIVQKGYILERDGRSLHESICSSLLIDLLPPTKRTALLSVLRNCKILPSKVQHDTSTDIKINIEETNRVVKLGELVIHPLTAHSLQLVPSPVFWDIPSQLRIIQTLLAEWSVGERAFLLLGNQGTGKNKICDRLCEILNHEREYIQLHRDTTIGQLTISPSLENGQIVWKDSPLVRAVINGRALVIDEADKAPLEVVAVLKSLVEDGELLLADGRRILRNKTNDDDTSDGDIFIHPNFTVWILANRPGKLFHGNDFYSEIGDCFAAHVVPNPDLASEVQLLQSYAPNIDGSVLRRLAASFNELRLLFDSGDITYPYSTREAVAVVKHLEKYPNDDVVAVLHNILDIDSYDEHQYHILGEVFRKHKFSFDSYERWLHGIHKSFADGSLRIEHVFNEGASTSPPPLTSPKLGKWDEKNEAHVGGNQWQGGTGGSDTAGLGGRGGPYRLDRGHKIHQVSEEAKAQVSQEAKAAARRIANKAFDDRMREIGMSKSDHKLYSEFLSPINNDIATLRAALRAVEFKASDRDWIKNQLDGELDDTKLIQGIAGEKHVYKRRGIIDPLTNHRLSNQPKRLRFVVDCSGSMYRFNSYDERLNRCLQATALIMEGFDGMDDKFQYSIVGHSGDSECIDLVPFGKPPSNEKERMHVLQSMIAHSQFCDSGDNTLAAVKQAMTDVLLGKNTSTSDDSPGSAIVIAISDANLQRYGIHPKELSRVIQSNTTKITTSSTMDVKAYCIFIASFGSEAESIQRELPVGRGFVCLDTSELPAIVRNILTSEIN